MSDYAFHGALKDAAVSIARAIEKHAAAQITAAKITANASARAAGNIPIHRDVEG